MLCPAFVLEDQPSIWRLGVLLSKRCVGLLTTCLLLLSGPAGGSPAAGQEAKSATASTASVASTGIRTATTVGSSSNPADLGQTVRFTAIVKSAAPGSGAPTGNAIFTADGIDRAPSPLANGQATLSLSTLSVGTHTISARYEGTTKFASSTSKPLTQTIRRATTTTTVVSSANPADVGQTVRFTATVQSVAPGSGTPSGNAIFTVDGVDRAPSPLANGQAALSLSTLSTGNHTISARYEGTADYDASTSSGSHR